MRENDKKILAVTGLLGVLAVLLIVGFTVRQPALIEPPAALEPAAGTPAPAPAAVVATTKPNAPAAPASTPAAAAGTAAAPAVAPVVIDDKEMQADLQNRLNNQFAGKLSFPLDESKMIAFTLLAEKVRSINDRWDVQVASAENDTMAIEYNNMAVADITHALQSNATLPLEQYNALTKLTASDPEFNKLYVAYRDLLTAKKPKAAAGVVSPIAPTVPVIVNGQVAPASQPAPASYGQPLPPVAQPTISAQPLPTNRQNGTGQPVPAVPPVAAVPAASSPAAVPINPGSTPTPQGSTTPQYSQPASR